MHDEPLAIDEAQAVEYSVELESDGVEHGFGVHVAEGDVQVPAVLHVAVSEPDDRYDVEPQAMLQVPFDG